MDGIKMGLNSLSCLPMPWSAPLDTPSPRRNPRTGLRCSGSSPGTPWRSRTSFRPASFHLLQTLRREAVAIAIKLKCKNSFDLTFLGPDLLRPVAEQPVEVGLALGGAGLADGRSRMTSVKFFGLWTPCLYQSHATSLPLVRI